MTRTRNANADQPDTPSERDALLTTLAAESDNEDVSATNPGYGKKEPEIKPVHLLQNPAMLPTAPRPK